MLLFESRPSVGVVKSMDDVNRALEEMGYLDRDIKRVKGQVKGKVAKITAKAEAKLAGKTKRYDELYQSVETFCQAELDAKRRFIDPRSEQLPHGKVGFKKATEHTPVTGKTDDDVIAAIKAQGPQDAIKTTESLVVSAIKDMGDKELAALHLTRLKHDKFYAQLPKTSVGKKAKK